MSEHPEIIETDEHHEHEQMMSLPDVPPILVLTMTTDINGQSQIRYNMPPPKAVELLRSVADSIEQEVAEAEAAHRADAAAEEEERREQEDGPA